MACNPASSARAHFARWREFVVGQTGPAEIGALLLGHNMAQIVRYADCEKSFPFNVPKEQSNA